MSNKMINQLNETATNITDNDYMVVDQKNSSDNNFTTKKVNVETIQNKIGEALQVTNSDPSGRTISTITLGNTTKDITIPNDIGGSGSTMATPIGTIIPWLGSSTSTIPYGYLKCDGSEVSKTEYSELFAVIGTKFGDDASEGKFKLPKLDDERYLQGNSEPGNNVDAGLPIPSAQLSNIRCSSSGNHSHQMGAVNDSPANAGTGNHTISDYTSSKNDSYPYSSESGDHNHTITGNVSISSDDIYGNSTTVTPKSMTVIYLICAKVISSFDPSKFHMIFFNQGNATSIEFTTKSLYEGSRYGRLPKYTLNGVEMNTWYEDADLTQQVSSTTIFNKTNDIELYNSITPDIPTQVTLSIGVIGGEYGTTSPEPGSYTYTKGSTAHVTANPFTGGEFRSWTGDVSSNDSTIDIVMDGDKSVAAYFVQEIYTVTLTTSPSEGGTVSGGGTSTDYERTVSATPNSGYRFVRWSDGGDQSHTVHGNQTLTAYFEEDVPLPKWQVEFANISSSKISTRLSVFGTDADGKTVTLMSEPWEIDAHSSLLTAKFESKTKPIAGVGDAHKDKFTVKIYGPYE